MQGESLRFRLPYFGDLAYQSFLFPGGESHVKILTENLRGAWVEVRARIRSGNDLMSLALSADALRRAGVKELHAYIPYFPYARQDRQMVEGEPLSVKVAADFVNSMGFDSVRVFDPHSDVTPALLNKCEVVDNSELVQFAIAQIGSDSLALVAPDAGAQKKQFKLCQKIGFDGDQILCSKARDLATGKILRQSFEGNPEGKDCLIVDDICDGGRTFIELAKQLRTSGARRVFLVVSHGIFSQGEQPLEEHIDSVFCTDSCQDIDSGFTIQFNVFKDQQ